MPAETPPAVRGARWLGAAGVLPFAVSGLAIFAPADLSEFAVRSLVAYGAVILSFLGGVTWGAVIARSRRNGADGVVGRLALSVVPSIIAWIALLMPLAASLWTLGASFLALLWLDRRSGRDGLLPDWYARLRLPLTLAAIVSISLGLMAVTR